LPEKAVTYRIEADYVKDRWNASLRTYYRAGRSYLRYDELYFERSQSRDVVALVAEGNVERLLAMPHARVPAVSVAMYRTPDNRFAAMQAFEYADLEYRPLTRLQISPQKEGACEA